MILLFGGSVGGPEGEMTPLCVPYPYPNPLSPVTLAVSPTQSPAGSPNFLLNNETRE